MSRKKIFIVLTHKHSLKPKSNNEWETEETIEFVDQLRSRHYSYASVIGDYINGKMIVGTRVGMGDYVKFDKYVREKYPKQMGDLDASYGKARINQPFIKKDDTNKFKDEFGNVREKTIFDV